jgi:hypothetical protein
MKVRTKVTRVKLRIKTRLKSIGTKKNKMKVTEYYSLGSEISREDEKKYPYFTSKSITTCTVEGFLLVETRYISP